MKNQIVIVAIIIGSGAFFGSLGYELGKMDGKQQILTDLSDAAPLPTWEPCRIPETNLIYYPAPTNPETFSF
jgi:hypothetical protein